MKQQAREKQEELKIPQTERGRARRKKILMVAERLFEEQGARVSISSIIRETGGSLSDVYKWFGCKDDLFWGALCERLFLVRSSFEAIRFSGTSVAEDITTLVEHIASNIPFKLLSVALLETNVLGSRRQEALTRIEDCTNVPITNIFQRIRLERGVSFRLTDKELAYIVVRYFRGVLVEMALGAENCVQRLADSKRLLVSILNSFIVCDAKDSSL